MSSFALMLAVAGAATPGELEEIVAKHVQAKGGKAWDDVETMKIEGSFTAFSVDSPFELVRKRDHRYFIHYSMNGHPVTIGHDDEQFWWDNEMRGPGAKPIGEGPDLQVVEREIDFATPLFDYAQRGFELKLLGQTEFEGIPAIGIELTRTDGSVETWYLDPDTHLELAREYPGSDFGRAVPARTFYDDFREVEGLMIPYFIESQWYTRSREMHVDSVEINVPVDDAIFAMPAPMGMAKIVPMIDSWEVTTSVRQQPGAPWQESRRTATVEGKLRGALLTESYTGTQGNEIIWTLSYDRFQETYRFTQITDATNHLDVLEGNWDDEGKLVLSDVETGTPWSGFGMTFHTRVTIHGIDEDGFRIDSEISTDGGENWFLAAKEEYRRDGGE